MFGTSSFSAGTSGPAIVALGGGHGLYQTLKAARLCEPSSVTAVVTVADDGGSSGRIRRELGIVPPGDLRMALAALAGPGSGARGDREFLSAELLQHRFGGHGALAGHAVGNLLLSGLIELSGDVQAALDTVAGLTGSCGRVVAVCTQPLDIAADVAGLDEDPRVMREVRGQVAVASTPGSVRRVRLVPSDVPAAEPALSAIAAADLVTLGPGSWFSSVIPHLLVKGVVEALNQSPARKVVVLNLSAEPGETQGFSLERHIHVMAQQAPDLHVDQILVDAASIPVASERSYLQRAARRLGAVVDFVDVRATTADGGPLNVHDPERLARALMASNAARPVESARGERAARFGTADKGSL
ncbi:gluconeogenesis factor YvcK family protein [Corynebacterium atypicum]|uniref:gluconeogenesis factor YvcK family protein n=1 Tax=Corynebacterium atypicum TaxID=191610 RepID=UPI000A004BB5|nr:uridine diphosphate-N-acetylglucosamine-binding protein YvcK [Corynebacterium atypicum]